MTLELRNITKGYDGKVLFQDVSVSFPETGMFTITGPSGTGKTTMLRVIAQLEKPDGGEVAGVPERIAMLFEDDRLLPWMDVLANVQLVGASREVALEILAELGLEGREHARISDLSSGQRRRVSLARALAFDAPLVLLDEPVARLDAETAERVMRVVRRRCDESLVLVAAHDSRLTDGVVFDFEDRQ